MKKRPTLHPLLTYLESELQGNTAARFTTNLAKKSITSDFKLVSFFCSGFFQIVSLLLDFRIVIEQYFT